MLREFGFNATFYFQQQIRRSLYSGITPTITCTRFCSGSPGNKP